MDNERLALRVGIAGAGVIGRGWVKVFARAGCVTTIYDKKPGQAERTRRWFLEDLQAAVGKGLITKAAAEQQAYNVTCKPIESAFLEVDYVQESGPEELETKRSIFTELDEVTVPSAIIGSSTSALNINEIAKNLPGSKRMITAHPINPPYLNPAMEVFPTSSVTPQTLQRALQILRSVGMKPVVMTSFINGYIAARLQAALMREAINIVQRGIATVEGVDTMVRYGIGQRWAFLGPFGVNHTNADGGIREYYTRYRRTYLEIMNDLYDEVPRFDTAMVDALGEQTDQMFGEVTVKELVGWRDERVAELIQSKVDSEISPQSPDMCRDEKTL